MSSVGLQVLKIVADLHRSWVRASISAETHLILRKLDTAAYEPTHSTIQEIDS